MNGTGISHPSTPPAPARHVAANTDAPKKLSAGLSNSGGTRKPYVRPMARWWERDPYFISYMARELTAFAVLAYSVVLLIGVVRLTEGPAAWDAWVDTLRSPWSIAGHLILLVAMVVHALSWFEIMPKTLPYIQWQGQRVPARTITLAGWLASVLCTIILLVLAAL